MKRPGERLPGLKANSLIGKEPASECISCHVPAIDSLTPRAKEGSGPSDKASVAQALVLSVWYEVHVVLDLHTFARTQLQLARVNCRTKGND